MIIKRKKTAVRAIFLYMLMTFGLWMFLNSYTNSYNKLSGEKISPAELDVHGDMAYIEVIDHEINLDLSAIAPESRLYCGAYLLSPDELRLTCYLISLCNRLGLHT